MQHKSFVKREYDLLQYTHVKKLLREYIDDELRYKCFKRSK